MMTPEHGDPGSRNQSRGVEERPGSEASADAVLKPQEAEASGAPERTMAGADTYGVWLPMDAVPVEGLFLAWHSQFQMIDLVDAETYHLARQPDAPLGHRCLDVHLYTHWQPINNRPPAQFTPAAAAIKATGNAELDAARIAEVLAEGDGCWRSCSGCLELEDGQNVHGYPHSRVFGCDMGGGCGECGGIGAIWDTTNYEAMGWEFAARRDDPATGTAELVEALREANDALLASNIALARAHDRIHCLPRTTDSEMARKLEGQRATNAAVAKKARAALSQFGGEG